MPSSPAVSAGALGGLWGMPNCRDGAPPDGRGGLMAWTEVHEPHVPESAALQVAAQAAAARRRAAALGDARDELPGTTGTAHS
eukprot:gene4199-58718_t